MKKIKLFAVSIIVLCCFSLPATAQTKILKLDLDYNYSFPMGSFKNNVISNSSPRGFMGSLLYSFSNKISGGLTFGFQDYYQKYPRALYNLSKTQEISAVLTNSIQTTPVLLKAKYFPIDQASVKPYISLAAGGNIIDYKQYFGEFGNSQSSFGFRAQGGIGVMVPFRKSGTSGINVGATYDYEPYNKNGIINLNSVNLQAGINIELK